MPAFFFNARGRLQRARKKIGRGKFEAALRMLVGMLNKGVAPELEAAVFLALAEAETGCGNFGNAGYYARQCEQALAEGDAVSAAERGALVERLRKLREEPA